MFSLACNLTKTTSNFFPIEILSKKVRGNNVNFSTIEITSKKVLGSSVDFSTSEIIPKKVSEINLDFRPSKLRREKYVETTGIFPSAKFHRKKYVEMMWKFIKIWSATYWWCNIDVESMSIWRGVPVWKPNWKQFESLKPHPAHKKAVYEVKTWRGRYIQGAITHLWLKSHGNEYYWSYRTHKNYKSYEKLNSFGGLLQGSYLQVQHTLYNIRLSSYGILNF